MGLGQNAPKTYLKIKNGKIVITIKTADEYKYKHMLAQAKLNRYPHEKTGEPTTDLCFDWFAAPLIRIKDTTKTFNGEDFRYWDMEFIDDNMVYVISLLYDSITFQGIANCLAAVEGSIENVKLIPWVGQNSKGAGVTKISVHHNGKKMGWKYADEKDANGNIVKKSAIPAGVPVMAIDTKTGKPTPYLDAKTGKPVISYVEKMEFFEKVVEDINSRCAAKDKAPKASNFNNGNGYHDEVDADSGGIPLPHEDSADVGF